MKRATVAAAVALGVGAAAAFAATGIELGGGGGWVALAPSPIERSELAAGRIGDGIYVVGGFEAPDGATTDALLRYDIGDDSWTDPGELADIPVGVNHPGVTAKGGYLYVYGGFRANQRQRHPTSALYRYNPETDHWKRLRDSELRRGAMAFAAIGDRLYAAGGKNGGNDRIRALEIYDVSENRWTRGPKMDIGRNHVAAAVVKGKLFVLGGRPGPARGGRSTVERYNPKTDSWKRFPPIPTARSGHAAANVGHLIVVFGGEDIEGPQGPAIEEVEAFQVLTGRWSTLEDMTMPRHGLGGVSYQGKVYALQGGPTRGLSFSTTTDSLEIN
jgi:N-acetylneuraminic acid mutarotase